MKVLKALSVLSALVLVLLGCSTTPTVNTAEKPVNEPVRVVDVSAGTEHALVLLSDGRVFGFGRNNWKQLGTNFPRPEKNVYDEPQYKPEMVWSGIKGIAAGHNFSFLIKNDNKLYVTYPGPVDPGYVSHYVTGLKTFGAQMYLTATKGILQTGALVQVMDNVKSVTTRDLYVTFIIKQDDSLWAFGGNARVMGQEKFEDVIPVKVMDDVVQVATGGLHTIVLKKDGSVWTFGEGKNGELGDGVGKARAIPMKIADNATFVSAGVDISYFINSKKELYAFGRFGNYDTKLVPTKIADNVLKVSSLFRGDEIYISGESELRYKASEYSKEMSNFSDVEKISRGNGYFIVLTKDGKLYSRGKNDFGQLGRPSMKQEGLLEVPIKY